MAIGGGVGSWRFTLALRSFVPKLAADVASSAERRSGAKRHWRVIILLGLHVNGYRYRPLSTPAIT